MHTLHVSCIQLAIVLFLLAQTEGYNETSAHHPNETGIITRCITTERSALLAFRAGLSDPANLLSSWEGDDCCRWKGVGCSKRTGSVVKLDVQGPDCDNSDSSSQVLGGNMSNSLLELHHLQYLDLSCNRFSDQQVPEFLSSLHNLRYLSLSLSSFIGRIPPQLGNLSNLRYFSIDSIFGDTYSTDISWLSRLSSLEHLDMSSVNLSTIVHWVPTVNMLRSLKSLHLPSCELRTSPDSLLHSNLTSLETLDISDNPFNKHVSPNWFWDVTNLKHLDVSGRQFHGRFPDQLGSMTSIVVLDLSGNNLVGMIPSNLNNLCNLEELYLSDININGSIAEFFDRLPDCSRSKLRTLYLPWSNLTGSLPEKLEPFSNLTWLDLGRNNLIGPMPMWIGELTKLTYLDLSYNNLDGIMNENHLSGLVSLERLSLTDNSIAIVVNSTWVPPFSLTEVELSSCILGPEFPMWLRWQTRIFNLDISNTSISDKVPDWFWKISSSVHTLNIRNNQISDLLPSTMEFMAAIAMDLSYNHFSGPIPKLPINLIHLDLSYNHFSGPIPKLPINLTDLDLSRNRLSGPLPADFGAPGLETLFLFDNYISGTIPSLCKFHLMRVDISRNKLTGTIPDCSFNTSTKNTSLSIVNLRLGNNKLYGKFPSFLQNCHELVFLDLANNQLSGPLPVWIGEKLPYLAFFLLRSNMFYDHIPVELTKLVNLQYLDLAYNNISGSLPESFMNFKGMARTRDYDNDDKIPMLFPSGMLSFGGYDMMDFIDNFNVVTKGQEQLYAGEIKYMVNLDLSCNNIIGQIPEEIGTLVALKNLNLSWNAFSGNIPDKIGALVQVESLDLSHNKLSGEIPNSLSALTSLSRLNLSYNNLSGKIPSGNQLQTLDDKASIYIGNPGLCGPPLSKSCSQTELVPSAQKDHEDESEKAFFFLAMGIGYVMGIWIVLCVFLFQRKWRAICFSFYDSTYDRVYVQVAVTWASFTFYKEKWAETKIARKDSSTSPYVYQPKQSY